MGTIIKPMSKELKSILGTMLTRCGVNTHPKNLSDNERKIQDLILTLVYSDPYGWGWPYNKRWDKWYEWYRE